MQFISPHFKASLQLNPSKRPTAREIVDYLENGSHNFPHVPTKDRTDDQTSKTFELIGRYEEFFQSVIKKLSEIDDNGIPTKIDDKTLTNLHKELEEMKQEMGNLLTEISGVCTNDPHCSETEAHQLEKLSEEEHIREEEEKATAASKDE